MGLCLAAAWAPKSGRAALKVGACSDPEAQATFQACGPSQGGFSLGAMSRDTALPISWLPLLSLGLMPSEHHMPLQPVNSVRVSLHEVWW